MALTDFERETIILYSDSSNLATLETYNKAMIRNMDEKVKKFSDDYKLLKVIKQDGTIIGKKYEFPKKLINVRQPNKRKMTEEQRKAAGERLKKNKK